MIWTMSLCVTDSGSPEPAFATSEPVSAFAWSTTHWCRSYVVAPSACPAVHDEPVVAVGGIELDDLLRVAVGAEGHEILLREAVVVGVVVEVDVDVGARLDRGATRAGGEVLRACERVVVRADADREGSVPMSWSGSCATSSPATTSSAARPNPLAESSPV